MNWFKRSMTRTAQTSAEGILMNVIQGTMDPLHAIKALGDLNDPYNTCNTIDVLINDDNMQSFPNAVSTLYMIGNELGCWDGTMNSVGDQNIGGQNVGDQNVGDQNVGDQNVGDQNVGDQSDTM